MLFNIIGYMFGFLYTCVAFPWDCWSTHWSKNVGLDHYLHVANQLLCHVTQGLLLLTQLIFLKLIVFIVSTHSSLSVDFCLVLIKALNLWTLAGTFGLGLFWLDVIAVSRLTAEVAYLGWHWVRFLYLHLPRTYLCDLHVDPGSLTNQLHGHDKSHVWFVLLLVLFSAIIFNREYNLCT